MIIMIYHKINNFFRRIQNIGWSTKRSRLKIGRFSNGLFIFRMRNILKFPRPILLSCLFYASNISCGVGRLEMLVGVIASRTFFRGLNSFKDVAAHEALPFDGFIAFPHFVVFNLPAH